MDSGREPIGSVLPKVGALVASSILFYMGTGLHPLWWLTWIAPIPILVLAMRVSGPQTFTFAVSAWCLGGLNMWPYTRYIPLPVIVLFFLIVPSLVFALGVLLFRSFARHAQWWRGCVGLPALWVVYEYLLSIVSPHGAFQSIAYTQMNFLPVIQLASITGIWGISFCVFLFATSTALLLGGHGSSRAWKGAATTVLLLLFVTGYGALRLSADVATTQPTTIALLVTDSQIFAANDLDGLPLLQDYAAHIRGISENLVGGGRLVVLLPEKVGLVSETAIPQVNTLFRQTAAASHATIVVGLERGTTTRRSNEARVYSPDGSLGVYVKQHLLPGPEDVDQAGKELLTWNEPLSIAAVEICKDMDFPDLSRKYAAKEVALVLVPAWDFSVDGWLHSRMTIMRAVENGFTVARAAKQGLLTVSDNRGRLLAEKTSSASAFSSLVVQVPVSHSETLYSRFGNWFAWANIAVLMATIFGGTDSKSRVLK